MGSRPCGPRRCRARSGLAPPQLLHWWVASSGTPATSYPARSRPDGPASRRSPGSARLRLPLPDFALVTPRALGGGAGLPRLCASAAQSAREDSLHDVSRRWPAGLVPAPVLPVRPLLLPGHHAPRRRGTVPARHSEPAPRRRHGSDQQPRADRRIPRPRIRGTQGARLARGQDPLSAPDRSVRSPPARVLVGLGSMGEPAPCRSASHSRASQPLRPLALPVPDTAGCRALGGLAGHRHHGRYRAVLPLYQPALPRSSGSAHHPCRHTGPCALAGAMRLLPFLGAVGSAAARTPHPAPVRPALPPPSPRSNWTPLRSRRAATRLALPSPPPRPLHRRLGRRRRPLGYRRLQLRLQRGLAGAVSPGQCLARRCSRYVHLEDLLARPVATRGKRDPQQLAHVLLHPLRPVGPRPQAGPTGGRRPGHLYRHCRPEWPAFELWFSATVFLPASW